MLLRQVFQSRRPAVATPLPPIELELDGKTLRIILKRHTTARRMVLRLARDGENFTLTLPKRQSISSAQTFVEQSRTWMSNTLHKRLSKNAEAVFMLRGVATEIVIEDKTRGLVRHDVEHNILHVPGGEAHWKRRLTDWLKREAEQDLRKASLHYAENMGVRFSRLTVRDQKSRWGSCSHDGALSYSWRLLMAPDYVLDYVVAHEVAHLKEMNHGPRFWRLVLTHCVRTREAKSWLKVNGGVLHRSL
jgi:predicted metal-dependent hydrolase